MLLEYKHRFLPRTTDYDEHRELRVSAYLDLFQTIAGRHADLIGIGFDDLFKQNLAWILAKNRLTVYKSPPDGIGSDVIVTTAPHPRGSLDYVRDYFVHNEAGELLAKGSGQWLQIDITTRRVTRPQSEYPGLPVDYRAYDNTRIEKIDVIPEGEHLLSYRIQNGDIDHNGHTNNIKYTEIIYHAAGTRPDKSVSECVVNYLSETRKGDEIDVYRTRIDENIEIYAGKRGETVVFTAKYGYRDND